MEFIMLFITLLILGAIVIGIWGIITYNKLQASKQEIIEQASNMQVSLQKRRDLASRILDIAQGFGDHEKLTHLKISSNQTASTESLAALSQNFPELKANQTYLALMKQLEELETNISNKREAYNWRVKHYNSYRNAFPTMLVAKKLNFESAPYYHASDENSLANLASFNRDDADAVKMLISTSTQSVKKSAHSIKEVASSKISEAIASDVVKSVVHQGDIALTKAVDVAVSQSKKLSKSNDKAQTSNEETKEPQI